MIPEFPQASRSTRKIFSSYRPKPHQTERKIPAERILYEDLFPDFHRCQKAEIICTRTVPADIKRYNSFRWSFRPVVIVIIGGAAVIRIATNGSGRWPARSVRADNARDGQLLQSRRRGWTLDAPFCRSVCVRKRPRRSHNGRSRDLGHIIIIIIAGVRRMTRRVVGLVMYLRLDTIRTFF